ncbi:TonB-dependent receptor [Sphingobacterium lactis]|uniref:TonB-dependent Receptor Plug Domain n=1 Tax=Sphingobacterium lactis TaxID=797291 RepID=A0A1H5XPS7_9SPHI|nr:TonB-dependent receptor [Sphingobacterium lactis]SEG13702.1 TonB-dependent Receptor Plug Domain [Sphingobacterium lactis]
MQFYVLILTGILKNTVQNLFKPSIMYVLLLLASSTLYAQAYSKLGSPVNIVRTKVNAASLFGELNKQTGYEFYYGTSIGQVIVEDIRYEKKTLGEVLAALDRKGFDFTVKGKNVAVKYAKPREQKQASVKTAVAARQQPGRIGGKIIDDRGEVLIGATVKIIQNNQAMQSSVDGSYSLTLMPGSYTVEVSYLAYQTKRVTQVEVKSGQLTSLNIVMNPKTSALEQVVVTGSFKKESTAGLYVQQKNAASVTDGISSEQIARTPDNNLGQVLKRVSGVTTVNNKYVVVRGLSDRYNQAMIDGVTLPSTNMNRRNFSFDVIPQELVSNVVVNKTATPDMPAEFSGGQVSVNTMDIPAENFTMISIGSGLNTQSTGKDFLMLGERVGGDYFALNNSKRKEPEGLQSWYWRTGVNTPPLGPNGDYPANMPQDLELIPGSGVAYTSFDAIAQSKRIDPNGLIVSRYKAVPFQNGRFALGRVYDLNNELRFGFSGGAIYRNQQSIVKFNNVRGAYAETTVNYMDSTENGPGLSYRFNSTIGAALNLGLQGRTFKVALKNMYSRILDDNFNEAIRIAYGTSNPIKFREQFQDPQVTWVLQHKLEGENLLGQGGIKMGYTLGLTRIGQQVQDQRRLKYMLSASIGGVDYFQRPNIYTPAELGDNYDYRMWTDVKETDYNWGVFFTKDFMLGTSIKNTAKIGYSGWDKHRTLRITKVIPYTSFSDNNNPIEGRYADLLSADRVGAGRGQAYYWAEDINGPTFDGTMRTHAPYIMLDQRFFEKLRLVYGVRAEHYNLANRQEEYIKRNFGEIDDNWAEFSTTGEKDWRLLPSVNLTYSLTSKMNLRAAYSKTAIRPDFRETAYFGFYDYELDANISGRQLVSTIVDNFDLRFEFYPTAGEIISVSGFYKKMKDPIELVFAQDGYYRFQNQYAAKNYGVEIEIRKSLGFIADKPWLHNLTLFGNGTILKSMVEAQTQPLPGDNFEQKREPNLDRPLYGQAPWIVNAGMAYQDAIFGVTATYNRSGPRSNTINLAPMLIEYENGRNMLDIQLSARVWKRKAEIKFNARNLLDEYSIFYRNTDAYESIKSESGQHIGWKLKANHSTAYEPEKGDRAIYRAKTGKNMTLSFTYNF